MELDCPGFLESCVGTVLLDRLEALHRDIDEDGLIELGDENPALLDIRLAAHLAGRVKLRRADAI